jgi:hypothetical protein
MPCFIDGYVRNTLSVPVIVDGKKCRRSICLEHLYLSIGKELKKRKRRAKKKKVYTNSSKLRKVRVSKAHPKKNKKAH